MAGKKKDLVEAEVTTETSQGPINKNRERQAILKEIEAKFGKAAVFMLGQNSDTEWEFRPTGSIALDIACGGGVPKGAPVVAHGQPNVGKSTIALMIAAEAQRNGEEIAIIDAEQAFNPKWARTLGMFIPENNEPYPEGYGGVWFYQPSSEAEKVMDLLEYLVCMNKFGVIILDSVSALVTQKELDEDFSNKQVGEQARLVAKVMRKVVWSGKLRQSGATLIIISQIRDKIGSFFGGTDETSGRALQFAAIQNMEVYSAGAIDITDGKNKQKIGHKVGVKLTKNKCAPPYRVAEFSLYYENGMDKLDEAVSLGKLLGIIQGTGWYYYSDRETGEMIIDKVQGEAKLKEVLVANPDKFDKLMADIYAAIRG